MGAGGSGDLGGTGGLGGNGLPQAGATSSGTGGVSGAGNTNAGTGGVSAGTGGAGDAGAGGSAGGGTGGAGGGSGGSAAGGAAGAAGTGSGGTGGECTPPATYANLFVTVSGKTQAESDQKLATAWSTLFNPSGSGTIYFNGPGSDESYVKDIYNNDVRSEGMSYGMMVAVQLDHQTEFDRIWSWVKNHMANGTGEIRWSCKTSGSGCAGGGAR